MNFQYIAPVGRSKDFLDLAFRKARQKSSKKLKGEWLNKIRTKEGIKLDVIKDELVKKIEKILDDFPQTTHLPEFYAELLKLTLDYSLFKKSLGSLNWLLKQLRVLHRNYARKIGKSQDKAGIMESSKQFYGRISSVVKQIDEGLVYLDKCRRIMRSYPDIKEMTTVCIYGFPNVGKSTLLNELTGTKAKIAAYAFTTKGINVGYLGDIQILDVPGTLARPNKMNNIEKIAYLAVSSLADKIIYVFDLTENCGYSIEDQKELFEQLDKKKVFVYLSKTDIAEAELISNFKSKHYSVKELQKLLVT